MVSPAFAEAYARLNARQKEVVDTIYGPVMVIAGPGTGKTQIIALRIGNILLQSTGTKPDEILALTFTESAVATLRTRLAGIIGSAAYRVRIHTFHSFAKSILDLRPDLFPRVALGTQLSDVSGALLMERLLDSGSYDKIRNAKNPHRTANALLAFMKELKKEHYTPATYLAELETSLAALLADPNRLHESGRWAGQEKGESRMKREKLEKHLEVARLFEAYEAKLREESLYDYEDLIAEAIRGLEEEEGFRAQVGERSQFVLADEHQDANPAQNRLLELVTDFDGAPNLCVVGDEKQAIYRFQGASLASFLSFREKYPAAKIISLVENYRSTEALLRAAHALMESAPVPDPELRPVLSAARGEGGVLEVVVADTPRAERAAICSHIEKLHERGVAYEDIAILVKKNADVLALADHLRLAGIPEDHVTADSSALAHPAVQLFISLIQATTSLGNDAALARALFLPGLPLSLVERQRLLATSRAGRPLLQVLEGEGGPEFRTWIARLRALGEEAPVTPVVTWLARLAQESGFVAGLLTLTESEEAYETYQGCMEEAALLTRENPSATVQDFLERLRTVEKHEIRVARPRTRRGGVQIMTVHKAKGLEFPQVIIAHAADETWFRGKTAEFSLMAEKEDDEHEVRRLFYVALTRAKDGVCITRSLVTEEDRAQTPLRFLSDMEGHVATVDRSDLSTVATESYTSRTILDPLFLEERLLARGFSPTGFNNFVQSPWQYYFRTLLQLPDAPSLPMHFGTAVHAGLQAYAEAQKAGDASIERASVALRATLARLPLTPLDRDELGRKGEEALRTYIEQERSAMVAIHEVEFAVRSTLTVPGVGEVPLTGTLDRLDLLPDGSVAVVDYKTGRARSENDIKGLTKSGDGGYYRQLVFYKLLLDRDGRYQTHTGALHFVEPDEKGRCIVRSFAVSEADVAALEAELVLAAKAIADGSAFATPCDSEQCDYCDLVTFLQK